MYGMRFFAGALTLVMTYAFSSEGARAQFPPIVRASDFDGHNGFVVRGTTYNQFGNTVTGLGDINADGIDDFASGDSGLQWFPDCYCEPTIGTVSVIFGSQGVGQAGLWTIDQLNGTNGFKIPELEAGSSYGSLSAAGDFNKDGIADFLVGAGAASHGVFWRNGACYVIYGKPGLGAEGDFDLASLNGSNGFGIYGSYGLALIGGLNIASIKDFNADGVDDIILASIRASSFTGQCYVVFGGTDIGASGEFSLADLSPDTGIIINGIAPTYATGSGLKSAGDFNGDGFSDIMIGTNKFPETGEPGEAYIVFGGPNITTNGVFELSDLNGENGFIIRAAGASAGSSGSRLAGFGDINGDGYDDVGMEDRDTLHRYWVDVIFGGPDVGASGELHAATLDGTNGFRILDGPDDSTVTVSNPDFVGDLNNDGMNDVGVRSDFAYDLWIIYGKPEIGATGTVVVGDGAGPEMFLARTSTQPKHVASAGDVNGDGVVDLAASMVYEQDSWTGADFGKVEVFFGRRMGDVDLDAVIDLADFQYWTMCMAGPTDDGPMIDGCQVFDFNRDGRVDLADFGGFQLTFEE